MFWYDSFLWVSVISLLISTFWFFIPKWIQRLNSGCKNLGNDANFNVNHSRREEDDQEEVVSMMIPKDNFFEEKTSSSFEFSFSFLYHQESKKDSLEIFAETDESGFVQKKEKSVYSSCTRRYQFVSGKNVCEFVQKAEEATSFFTIQEMFVDSVPPAAADSLISKNQILDFEALPMNECVKEEEGVNNFEEKVAEFDPKDPLVGGIEDLNFEQNCEEIRQKTGNLSVSGQEFNDFEDGNDDDDITYDFQWFPNDEFPVLDLDPKSSESSGDDDDSCSNNKKNLEFEFELENFSDQFPNEILSEETIVTEYIELKPDGMNITNADEEILLRNHESDCSENFEKSSLGMELEEESRNSVEDEYEDEDEFDILLEHKQLVQRMKMEMKNSKIKSLPTIVEEDEEEEDEEFETTKMVEDLKPLNIEKKFEYKDLMEEIHKFYKSYAEKMRKLDILNYQCLNAINIVQHKDSRVFDLRKKASSFPFIKHFGLPTFGIGKQRKVFADPSLKSITDVQRDLELVYIGQVCLSWEILKWQYEKLKLLLDYEYDFRVHHHHSYNVVAGEYQQLQVLMHRFLEEELIQGPRIKHYVERRCLSRSLLQVPIIKDDPYDKKNRVDENDAIPITKLAETIKKSMQLFLEFIRSDKDGTNISSSFKNTRLSNPADLELLSNVKTCLKKKERKLKDVQKSANCIVKKFQKHHNHQHQDLEEEFISEVELKLVSRVVNFSRLTNDQLQWCLNKLNNIDIVSRNVHVEHSFLLFPC